jgi:hypothetical protein
VTGHLARGGHRVPLLLLHRGPLGPRLCRWRSWTETRMRTYLVEPPMLHSLRPWRLVSRSQVFNEWPTGVGALPACSDAGFRFIALASCSAPDFEDSNWSSSTTLPMTVPLGVF